MTLDTIFSVLGILLAAIALMPSIKRQEMSLKIRMLDWLIILSAVLLIHYLTFFSFFRFWGISPGLGLHKYGLSPSILSYLILYCSAIFIILRVRYYRLQSSEIHKFKSFIDQLISRRMYSELSTIFEKNIERLIQLANNKYSMGRFHSKIRRKKDTLYPIEVFLTEKSGKKIKNPNKIEIFLYRLILTFMPDHNKRSESANYLLRTIMLKRDLVDHFALNAPYLGLILLKHKSYYLDTYVDEYFKSLLLHKNSLLYFELKNNQNTDGYAYQIDSNNRMISFLFNPATNSEDIGVWRPIGEYVIHRLEELYVSTTDKYLIQNKNYYENGKWESSIFIGIYFFDVMIKSALKQNISWHMWLYYYKYFVDGIERNLSNYVKRNEEYYEWETPYHYLISIVA